MEIEGKRIGAKVVEYDIHSGDELSRAYFTSIYDALDYIEKRVEESESYGGCHLRLEFYGVKKNEKNRDEKVAEGGYSV